MNTKIRKINRSKILTLINKHGHISRKEIADKLKITSMTVSNIINCLIKENICKEIGKDLSEKRIGRKKLLIEIEYDYKKAIGINIRTVKDSWEISIVITNINRSKFTENILFFNNNMDENTLLSCLIKEIKKLLCDHSLKDSDILGMGISITGLINSKDGIIINSLTGLKNIPLVDHLKNHFLFPIHIINNIKALAISKLIFNNLDIDNYIYLRYDEGIGSAIIYNNVLFNETIISAGKLSHLTINSTEKRRCSCGRLNCLESFVHFKEIRKTIPSNLQINNKELIDLYGGDNIKLNDAFDKAFKLISLYLSNIARFMGISNIVLDGYIFSKKKIILAFLKEIKNHSPLEGDTLNFIQNNDTHTKAFGAVGYLLMKEFYKTNLTQNIE